MASTRIRNIVAALLLTGCVVALFATGMWLRDWTWNQSDSIHFRGDVNRAREHGNKIVAAATDGPLPSWHAVFNRYLVNYDQLIAERPEGNYDLDYPPIRLLIMTGWSRLIYNAGSIEDITTTPMVEPLLRLNTCAELLAAIAAFLLVRCWVEVDGECRWPWLDGLGAATLIWFDPSLLLDAHGWPQWDAWVVPFFLFAAWAASTDRWLVAGTILGIGGGFKGQLWAVAPILVLWPLFAGRWMALLRIVVGWALGVACIHSMWVLAITEARWWIGTVLLVSIVLRIVNRRKLDKRIQLITYFIAAIVMLWPWIIHPESTTLIFAFCLVVGLLATTRWIPIAIWSPLPVLRESARVRVISDFKPRSTSEITLTPALSRSTGRGIAFTRKHAVLIICALLTSTIFLAGEKFNASFGWFKIGIVFGAQRHQQYLFAGIVNNLPTILRMRFGWQQTTDILTSITFRDRIYEITIGQFLIALYIFTLAISAIGLVIHARRKSRYALISLIAPWILFYAIMQQMRERYLLWGGAMSAIWIGVGLGPILLHVIITLLSVCTILQVMLNAQSVNPWPSMSHALGKIHPDAAWAVLMCAAVVLFLAITPMSRRSPPIK